jgi:hypothetical protein
MEQMQHMQPMDMHGQPMQLIPPGQPMQPMQYFEAPEAAHGVLPPPPPPPPVCLDMGDGLAEKFEKAEAPVEPRTSFREPEPESDSNSRSEDEAVLLSFGANDEPRISEPAQSSETIQSEKLEEEGSKSGAEREPSPEVLRSSEWKISKGRKGKFVEDRFRKGAEAPAAAAPTKEKTETKAAAPAAEKTKVAEYPWKRGKKDVVIETPEVEALEAADTPKNPQESPIEEFENLPVTDLLGWLESHAPKDFLEVHLRQICEEVELMKA